MAEETRTPIQPPSFDYRQSMKDLSADMARYTEQVAELARKNGDSDLLGKEVRFQIADGYAQYIVWDTAPLTLTHLPLGDCWQIPKAMMRGLDIEDIRANVEMHERRAALFS